MKGDEPITLRRDCEAILIPSGARLMLRGGSGVWLTQSLGGSYTVMTDRGSMVRISGKDGDALGLEAAVATGASASGEGPAEVEKLVWDRLRTCFDPEIPINIVDLGLVYGCKVLPLAQGGSRVEIKFTLTAPGCGMGEVLKADVKNRILDVPGIREVDVQLVWDPPWDQSKMSEQAKLRLGIV